MYKIIVADDSEFIRNNMKKILNDLGYEDIIEAVNGVEAVDKYLKFRPNILFLDITMPKKNGLETLEDIKRIDNNAKVIMATTHGEQRVVMDAIMYGASGYVLKPLNPDNIKKTIEKVMSK